VLIWFAAGSVAIVWAVFQSPAIDFRMIVLGALLPLVETPWQDGPLHTLAAPTLVLVVVMLSTVGRRLVRRRWLGLPIGMFLHLVLDGSWTRSHLFWWPFSGLGFGDDQALVVARGWWSVLLDVAGIAIAAWLWDRFGLSDPGRRRRFLRTGQLDRQYVSEPRP
jgi:hypothetical protein